MKLKLDRKLFFRAKQIKAPITKRLSSQMFESLDMYLGMYCLFVTLFMLSHWEHEEWFSRPQAYLMILFTIGNMVISPFTKKIENPIIPEVIRYIFGIPMAVLIASLAVSTENDFWFLFMVYALGYPVVFQAIVQIRVWFLLVLICAPYIYTRVSITGSLDQLYHSHFFLILGALVLAALIANLLTRTLLEVGEQLEDNHDMLKEQQSQLVQSAKLASLGEMSSGVAHELNNPLHFIKGFNNRIKSAIEKKSPNELNKNNILEYVKIIDENCNRMQKIIQHFRDFSRQSENQMDKVHINNVIEKSFVLLNEQLRLRSIHIEKKLDPSDPIVLGDANRLEQVIVNLIANARDALEKSPYKSITVTTELSNNNVIIKVIDSGPGIPKDFRDKIFNPFFTTKEVGKGTGLGLSISHGIIKDHKGQISCDSNLGKGTTFIITLDKQTEEKPSINKAS